MSTAPVVYLDQAHWVTMARVRVSPQKIRPAAELDAATRLWKAVDREEVRLPLSMAHVVETSHRQDDRSRVDLADAMLDGYHGWHMHHPQDVRRTELGRALRPGVKPPLTTDAVFSRHPGTPFNSDDGYKQPTCTVPGLSEQQRRAIELADWQRVWRSLLRDEKVTPAEKSESDAVVAGWADLHANLAAYIAENPANPDMRGVAATRTLVDLKKEIARIALYIGFTQDEFDAWISGLRVDAADNGSLQGLVDLFAAMPFVGRVTDVTYQRLRNPQEKWVRNDLNDMMYLCCAAAYADIVVAEGAMTHRLVDAKRRTTLGAVVVKNIRGLTNHLGL